MILSRADIEDFPGIGLLQQQDVGLDHVAHVQPVAPGLEIAHAEDGLLEPRLDPGHLPGEGR